MPSLSADYPSVVQALAAHYGQRKPAATALAPLARVLAAGITGGAEQAGAGKYLEALDRAGLLEADALAAVEPTELLDTLRDQRVTLPPRLAVMLKRLAGWFAGRFPDEDDAGDEAAWPTPRLRQELTAIRGIGQAKADAILLFGLGRPAYPVDRGTYRVLVRHGWIEPWADHDEVSQLLDSRNRRANQRAGPAVGLDDCGGQGLLQARLAAMPDLPAQAAPARAGTVTTRLNPRRTAVPWSARCRFMANYKLEGPKPARMYEVILPKKLGYFGKVQEVLEDLFDERAIRAIPFVRNSIAKKKKDPHFDEKAWIKTLCQASRGYSIYEMDGRYLSPSGPVDERVLVIRFIFHNPGGPKDLGTDFLAASLEVVNHLVAHRFANELGVEEEIWFLEYHQPQLAIWRRNAPAKE